MTTRARRWIAGSAAAAGRCAWRRCGRCCTPGCRATKQLAAQVGARFEQTFGIGLRVGGAHWSLRPVPVMVLSELSTDQPQPITVRRVVLRPRLAALWRRQIAVDSAEIEGAVLPARLGARLSRPRPKPEDAVRKGWPAAMAAGRGTARRACAFATWSGSTAARSRWPTTADIEFDPRWRPRRPSCGGPACRLPRELQLEREGEADRWRTTDRRRRRHAGTATCRRWSTATRTGCA